MAVQNAEAIAQTPGLDCLILGPGDMRISLDLPSSGKLNDEEKSEFVTVVDRLIEVAEQYRMPLMTSAFKLSESDSWVQKSNVLLTGVDLLSLASCLRQDLDKI